MNYPQTCLFLSKPNCTEVKDETHLRSDPEPEVLRQSLDARKPPSFSPHAHRHDWGSQLGVQLYPESLLTTVIRQFSPTNCSTPLSGCSSAQPSCPSRVQSRRPRCCLAPTATSCSSHRCQTLPLVSWAKNKNFDICSLHRPLELIHHRPEFLSARKQRHGNNDMQQKPKHWKQYNKKLHVNLQN